LKNMWIMNTRRRWYKTSECSALCYIWT